MEVVTNSFAQLVGPPTEMPPLMPPPAIHMVKPHELWSRPVWFRIPRWAADQIHRPTPPRFIEQAAA